VKEKTKAYMAGLMDAEGTFSITSCIHNTLGHRLYDPTVAIHITDYPILKWVVSSFGGTIYKRKPTEGKLQDWDWRTDSYEHSTRFIKSILPYLVLKKDEAKNLLEFYSLYRQQVPRERHALYIRSQVLKTRIRNDYTQDFLWKSNLINAYFAGWFDGEGTVGYQNDGHSVRLSLGNTAVGILDVMKRRYDGSVLPMSGRPEHHTPMFQWQSDTEETNEATLLKLLPYLRIKREPAKLALLFIRKKKI